MASRATIQANRARTLSQIRVRYAFGPPPARRKRLPRQQQPDMIRVEYAKAITAHVNAPMIAAVNRILRPKLPEIVRSVVARRGDRMDASGDVNALVDAVSRSILANLTSNTLAAIPQQFGQRTSAFQRQQLTNQIRAALGVDLYTNDSRLNGLLDTFVTDNVALIKTVPTRYFGDVEKTVTSAIRDGARAGDIADILDTINEGLDASEQHAAFNSERIARDQIGKLNGQINEQRQTDLGLTGYVWRTMNDNRVREEHEELEGQSFEWNDPPEEGNPGEPIMCRCYAEPDFSPLLDDL